MKTSNQTIEQTAILSLKTEFIMTSEEIAFLDSLPDNLPESKLTEKQIQKVSQIYRTYISQNQVFKGWGTELYEVEQKEKWPSGPRVKKHEAQRFILGWLSFYNKDRATLTGKRAVEFLFHILTCREADQILVSKCFTYQNS